MESEMFQGPIRRTKQEMRPRGVGTKDEWDTTDESKRRKGRSSGKREETKMNREKRGRRNNE